MAQSLTHSVALGSMPLSVMSAGHEDLLLLARELMTLSLLHETELRRIVDKYPLVNELQPELPSLSASRMSQLNSPYYVRSSMSSADAETHKAKPSGISTISVQDEKSDGSEGIPCALFQSEPQVSAEPPPHSHSPILEGKESGSPSLARANSKARLGSKASIVRPEPGETDVQDTTMLDSFMGVGVLLNALLIAFELECEGSFVGTSVGLGGDLNCVGMQPFFFVAEHLFTGLFLLELCYRLRLFRMGYFADLFNLFDTLLILACCVDLYILRTVLGEQTPLRVLRMFKLARVARLVRLMQLFRGLRLLVSACRSFLPSLGWAMALLSLCMLMGGVTMGLLLQDFIRDEAQDLHLRQWMWLRYGTAYRATYTMYEITFAGNWPQNVRPVLDDVSHAFNLFFVTYITIVVFAVIRVITAIFLSQTLEAAINDVDLMIQERIRKKSIFVEQLEGIFQAIDESGDGLLSEDEMKELLQDSRVQAYLESLEVNLPESEALFRLLQNSDGQITYDDFIEGILRCKGPARAMDQIVLQAEVKALGDSLQKLQKAMEEAKLIQASQRQRRNRRHHTHLASQLALLQADKRKAKKG
ncbi:unnamed protein product [Durusdinium trenchii]|uniref:EF-hand domain-containing protein n=1 Tax=Durusdinium trenchii TaxID=1381693 RepID=A0ABP0HYR7_9DINO